MKLRRPVCVAVALATTALFIAIWLQPENGPMYRGRSVRSWVNDAMILGERGRAREEMPKIGAPAVPYLLEKLKTKDTWVRRHWIGFLGVLPSSVRQCLPAQDIRFIAASCLMTIGTNAVSAMPELIRLVETQDPVADFAVNTLGEIGSAASNALPVLRAASPPNSLSQLNIASAVWRIGRDTNFVLRCAMPALTNRFELNAANLLGEMGPAALPAVPALVQVLNDRGLPSALRGNTAVAIGRIGSRNEQVLQSLCGAMRDDDLYVRFTGAISQWMLDEACAEEAAPICLEWIAESNRRFPHMTTGFIELARVFGVDPKKALATLHRTLDTGSPEVRQLASDALHTLTNGVILKLPE